MKLLSHHTWIKQPGFRRWQCSKCGAERFWNSDTQRMMFSKFGKTYYSTPDCASMINCDPIFKQHETLKPII